MDKWLVIFGVSFILIGVLVTPYSNSSKKDIGDVLVTAVDRAWNTTAELVEGDRILINMWQGLDWPEGGGFEPPSLPSDPIKGLLFVYIEVVDPQGNFTTFEVQYTPSETPRYALSLWKINVTKEGSGLNATLLYSEEKGTYAGVGGVVTYSGKYLVIVTEIYPPRNDPPSRIEIRKGEIITTHPYTFLLPVGVVLSGVGTTFSLFGFRKGRHKNLIKRKKLNL